MSPLYIQSKLADAKSVQQVRNGKEKKVRTGIDGEKGSSEVHLTLQIMTMKKIFKNVYNTCL